jgi:hypothetical protein
MTARIHALLPVFFVGEKLPRRGSSMLEMMISMGIIGMVSVGVAWIMLASARSSYEGISFVPTEARARLVLDTIRRETLVGQFHSVTISDAGKTVQFYDPVKQKTSEFRFYKGSLYYKEDASGSVTRTIRGLQNVEFNLAENSSVLQFRVTAMGHDSRRSARPVTLSDGVLMRNMPFTGTAAPPGGSPTPTATATLEPTSVPTQGPTPTPTPQPTATPKKTPKPK